MTRKVKGHHLEDHSLNDLVARQWGRNPRVHDLQAIADSLGKFGYAQPILIDETSGRIVAGHGVLASLVLAADDGQSPPHRVTVTDGEWMVTCVHVQLAEGEADAYSLSDTRTRELGSWDDSLLLEVLSELQAQDALTGTGFYPDDIVALQAKVSGQLPASFTEVPDPAGESSGASKEVQCPHCGEKFRP